MTSETARAKRALRAELRERRGALSEAQRTTNAESLHQQLDLLLERIGASHFSCYLSTTTEPGTRSFVDAAARRGDRVLLPITRADGLLDWAVATPDGQITEGLLGMPEPGGELLGPIAVHDTELMIIPAAAAAHDGTRLGWGGGFFDKTLGSMQNRPPVYAVVFDSEVFDALPRDRHDQRIDGVVTPTRILRFDH